MNETNTRSLHETTTSSIFYVRESCVSVAICVVFWCGTYASPAHVLSLRVNVLKEPPRLKYECKYTCR